MTAYYNEIDPYCAEWLKHLMLEGLIAPGEVDTRSIEDVLPSDLDGFTQCHFFAGIGGWSYALRLAGWPDDRPVWTGSCPCQPFSAAGKGKGFADERHLWPSWFHLIRARRPELVFGEQVASAMQWIDLVQGDMEAEGYALRYTVLGAHSVGAPHIRQRLYWVAHDDDGQREVLGILDGERTAQRDDAERRRTAFNAIADQRPEWLANSSSSTRLEVLSEQQARGQRSAAERGGEACELGDSSSSRGGRDTGAVPGAEGSAERQVRSLAHEPWAASVFVYCRDGKRRPVEPGSLPILDGVSASLGRMRAAEETARQEVIAYANACNTDPDEVLRMVRSSISTEARRKEQRAGVCEQLPAPAVLLSFLLHIQSTRNRTADRRCVSKAGDEARSGLVRGVRPPGKAGSTSCERRSDEQPAAQSADTLLALSFVLARLAETHRQAARQADAASNRIGRLKGYGNAIVPQAAAAFITACQSSI